jgi:hypothetical protein
MALPIDIFRAGRHVAMSGEAIEFADKDLDGIVSSYDPKVHEAPVVIGHPTDNAPAYGWIKSLGREGNTLRASADQIDPAFREAVKAGRYKKVSASFYKPDSATNPKPGTYYLRHVGFLGAQPPAVKGLREASFAGKVEDALTIELAAPDTDEGDENELDAIGESLTAGSPMARLRAWIIKMFGLEAADEAIPEELAGIAEPPGEGATDATAAAGAANLAAPSADDLYTAIAKLLPPELAQEQLDAIKKVLVEGMPQPTEAKTPEGDAAQAPQKPAAAQAPPKPPTPPANMAESVSRVIAKALDKNLSERERKLVERERATRRSEHASFLDALVRTGRPLPCKRETMIGLLEALDAVPAKVVSFGEGEKRSAVDIFKADVLERLPAEIEYAELAPAHGNENEPGDDAEAIAKEAIAFREEQRAKGIEVTTTEAVRHVSQKGR